MKRLGISMVVSEGSKIRPSEILSNPIMAISSGILYPRSLRALMGADGDQIIVRKIALASGVPLSMISSISEKAPSMDGANSWERDLLTDMPCSRTAF